MTYYCIEPEVAGGFGANTVYTRIAGKPTVVHRLHYHFDGWLGDELLTTTPCFIVTKRLAAEIELASLSGVILDEVEVTTSEQFDELYANRQLPEFKWLKVGGAPGYDDFGIAPDLRLVVSERALELMKRNGVANAASIVPFEV